MWAHAGGWSIFVLDGVAGGDTGSTRDCTAVKEGSIEGMAVEGGEEDVACGGITEGVGEAGLAGRAIEGGCEEGSVPSEEGIVEDSLTG